MVFVATGRSNGTQCVTPLPTQVYHDVTLSTDLVISDVRRSLTLRRFVLFISMLQFFCWPSGTIHEGQLSFTASHFV